MHFPRSLHMIPMVLLFTPQWMMDVVQGYQLDEDALTLIAKLAISSHSVPGFTLHHGLLRYNNRI